jgi:hypothetical protein
LQPEVGDAWKLAQADLGRAVSFEVWICPAADENGRILDKITAGKGDGFLLDCFPGLSLRLISGAEQRTFRDVLRPGVWQDVVIVLDRWQPEVYLDGKRL